MLYKIKYCVIGLYKQLDVITIVSNFIIGDF